jgi:lipopolysaccharide/colanic/teichoic acid biosynthesis glycosyltransferase
MPTIDFFSVGITLEERIIKRLFDICVSSILLIILTPLYILVAVCIYATDSAGPIIYRNRRVGKNGELFDLYKFRYMYWKYCTKEAYSIEDDALDIEKKLISTSNTRT